MLVRHTGRRLGSSRRSVPVVGATWRLASGSRLNRGICPSRRVPVDTSQPSQRLHRLDWNQGSNSSSLANMESGQPTETGSASGHPPESADCGRPADAPDSGGRADIGREEPPQQQLLLTSPQHFPIEEMAEEVGTAPTSPTWPSDLGYPQASRSTSGNPCNPHDTPPPIVAPSIT